MKLHEFYTAGQIRNRYLSADLKPALRELAAISEGLKEFAMVRDESGRYVEVPEQSGGNTALKVGAGVAGLAAVGGAYKGHQAVMNKFSPVGPRQAGFGGVKEAYGNAGKAAWNATSGAAAGAVGAAKGGLRGGLLKIARAFKPARMLAARSERVVELARGDHAIPALMKLYPKNSAAKTAADLGGNYHAGLLPARAAENDAKFALRGLVHPRYADPGNTANPWRKFPDHGVVVKQDFRQGVAVELKHARRYQKALNAASAERKASKEWKKMNPGALSGDW